MVCRVTIRTFKCLLLHYNLFFCGGCGGLILPIGGLWKEESVGSVDVGCVNCMFASAIGPDPPLPSATDELFPNSSGLLGLFGDPPQDPPQNVRG